MISLFFPDLNIRGKSQIGIVCKIIYGKKYVKQESEIGYSDKAIFFARTNKYFII